ncbi:MAG: ExsB family transcriptional regulator [Candidatus Omnitrophica bacterium]|nr:ExsB family transcriptional regulator [Candidatus Omnitrophota bacterium]
MAVNVHQFIREKVEEIRTIVKEKKALCAVSGGVDSMVSACLAQRALGENLVALFLDNGLMRANEAQEVTESLKKQNIELQVWDVRKGFFEALRGIVDPEEKRKAFRDIFYKTLGQAIRSYSADFLIQGTIAADIVETQKGIKTQHNVLAQIGVNPALFGLSIVEPLRTLYKDDVRKVAKALELPQKVYMRKPFPGPGLATRIIGEVTEDRVEKIRLATAIVEELITGESVFQAFPVLLSDRATGILGDKRILGEIIALRVVESKDALKANACKLPWSKLEKVRDRLLKDVPGVIKVVYDITPKPPSTIEYI